MQIAIVNDEVNEIYKIQNLIFNMNDNFCVDHYLDGTSFLKEIEAGKNYDLLMCDIYLKDGNGIEIAKRTRSISPQTHIVFITNSREHAVDAFSVDAVHYLVKPVSQENIIEVFQRIDNKAEPRHTLTIRIDRAINVLYQDEIIRIESNGHNTEIICANNTAYSIRKTFREIDELLDETFIQIKKGVTLNMHYISRMTYKECMTQDGKTYLLRRDHAKDIREKYYSFVQNKLNNA